MQTFRHLDRCYGAIPLDIVQQLTGIAEARGRQEVFRRQNPAGLEALREVALIQSTEASNAIEQITAPRARIEALVRDKTTPANRSEQEIAGYRSALDLIHGNGPDMPFETRVVLQIHSYLGRFTGARDAGRWKGVDNIVEEEHADGTKAVRFKPLGWEATPDAMDELHASFNRALAAGAIPHLLLSAAYIIDFLTIHPFRDGNGRMSRLITTWMLYLGGMDVGRYISLEKVIDESKASYYETLRASTQRWHQGEHDVLPWTRYFLGIVTAAFKQFEEDRPRFRGGRQAPARRGVHPHLAQEQLHRRGHPQRGAWRQRRLHLQDLRRAQGEGRHQA